MPTAEPIESLTRAQIEVFAAGLYRIASCDGIDPRERRIIEDFLKEARATDLADRLEELAFDPVHAYRVLGTSWLRSTFLRAAILLVNMDGRITEAERDMIAWLMAAFGIPGNVETLSAAISAEGFPS
jgi:uncharacterized membrane protein YebE (DUF533 family)